MHTSTATVRRERDQSGQQIRRGALEGRLATLSEIERRSIVLTYFGGYTYRQVAALLDQPERAIAAAICTGLKLLQDW